MLDAVALRLALVYELLAPSADPGHAIVASGGALERSDAWTQTIADAIGRPIVRLTNAEASGRGAALLALHALGRLPRLGGSRSPSGRTFEPDGVRHLMLRESLAEQQALDGRV